MKVTLALLMLALGASPAFADGSAAIVDSMDGWLSGDDPSRGNAAQSFVRDMSGWSSGASSAAGAGARGAQMLQQFNQMFTALSDLDRELRGRMQDDHSGPSVPTSCGAGPGVGMAALEQPASCSECFERAYREVNFTRNTLERLRTIHSRTMAYIRRAEGFGDSVSGVHGISGLSWQYAKANVEQEKGNLVRASRAKYDGLVENMHRALDMVAQCEREHFHNPDWYDRYGFMYLQFVKEAYTIRDE